MDHLGADAAAGPSPLRARSPVVQNLLRIMEHEDAVQQLDPDHYTVYALKTPTRRVRVYRRGDQWRCKSDTKNNQDQPCSHILAVLVYRSDLDLPNTAATVYRKGTEGRNHPAEDQAWKQMQVRAPQLLRDLLRAGLPVVSPEPPPRHGHPERPAYAKLFQAVVRVLNRQSLRQSVGALNTLDGRELNPYGPVSRTTLSDYLARPETTVVLEKLLALSTWPARPYETLAHPDGTGLTEHRFSDFFDEKYRRRRGSEARRLHRWTFVEILWSYRYTMIAALYAQDGPFGEAPWLLPLLERARLMLEFKELGGDKAYDSNEIYAYAQKRGLEAQIKYRNTGAATYSHHKKKYRKQHMERARFDPEGFAARANRRNNAETGNRAFKAILGDQVFSRGHRGPDGRVAFTARRNEILCMALAYNLTRLVFLEAERGIQVDFMPGVERLNVPWPDLAELRQRFRVSGPTRPEWT